MATQRRASGCDAAPAGAARPVDAADGPRGGGDDACCARPDARAAQFLIRLKDPIRSINCSNPEGTMAPKLQVNPQAILEAGQRLRAWEARWAAARERCQQTARALAGAVRAVPGQRFEAAAETTMTRLAAASERVDALARTLAHAMDRLEAAFQQAARLVAPGSEVRSPLPTVPLAVGPDGERLPSQFVIQIPLNPIRADLEKMIDADPSLTAERKAELKEKIQKMADQHTPIPYNLACGWVALSMTLSHQLGRPIPAQEVVNRALETHPGFRDRVLRNLASDLQANRTVKADSLADVEGAWVTTGTTDLKTVAQTYGVTVESFTTPAGDRDPDAVWEHIGERLRRKEDVIALVNAAPSNYAEAPIPNQVPGTGLRFSEEHGEGSVPAGGRLRPWGSNGVPHWVVVNQLEEHNGERFVVINNPFNNRTERYRWEDFLKAIDGQKRHGSQWGFLAVSRRED